MFENIVQSLLGGLGGVDIKKALEAAPARTYENASAGNMVKISMTNRLTVENIDIDAERFQPENKYLIEEMLVSAMNDLIARILNEANERLQKDGAEKSAKAMSAVTSEEMKQMMESIAPNGKIDSIHPDALRAAREMVSKIFSNSAADESNEETDDEE